MSDRPLDPGPGSEPDDTDSLLAELAARLGAEVAPSTPTAELQEFLADPSAQIGEPATAPPAPGDSRESDDADPAGDGPAEPPTVVTMPAPISARSDRSRWGRVGFLGLAAAVVALAGGVGVAVMLRPAEVQVAADGEDGGDRDQRGAGEPVEGPATSDGTEQWIEVAEAGTAHVRLVDGAIDVADTGAAAGWDAEFVDSAVDTVLVLYSRGDEQVLLALDAIDGRIEFSVGSPTSEAARIEGWVVQPGFTAHLQVVDGVLTVPDPGPAAGWTAEETLSEPDRVVVRYTSADEQLELVVDYRDKVFAASVADPAIGDAVAVDIVSQPTG